MYLIQQITDSALQQQSLLLYNGEVLTLTLYYLDSQQGWFANLVYNNFILNGIRITVNPNMLIPFKNQIPFGFGCFTKLLREPTLIQDFLSGNFNLYILSQTEVDEYNNLLNAAAP